MSYEFLFIRTSNRELEREGVIRKIPCFSTSVNGFSNYVVEERARKLIVKSYSTQEREREHKHETNEIEAYLDTRSGAILREAEPTGSRVQEDGVMRT